MDPFIGEIRIFALSTYLPQGFLPCEGQVLPIVQYQLLASVLGFQYGGDGKTTFGLPDLRGKAAMGSGNGPNLTARSVGQTGGSNGVTLDLTQIPAHNHAPNCQASANSTSADGTVWANGKGPGRTSPQQNLYVPAPDPSTTFNALAVSPSGGNYPHENMQPGLVMRFGIAWDGIYPVKS